MLMTRRLVLGIAFFALAACASSDPDDQAAHRAEIDAGADAALNELFAEIPPPGPSPTRPRASSFSGFSQTGLAWAPRPGTGSFALVKRTLLTTTRRAPRSVSRSEASPIREGATPLECALAAAPANNPARSLVIGLRRLHRRRHALGARDHQRTWLSLRFPASGRSGAGATRWPTCGTCP